MSGEAAWLTILNDLLTGRATAGAGDSLPGAELRVLDDTGSEVFTAALARHWRQDPEDPNVVWVRPIGAPSQDPETNLPLFDTDIYRRRALDVQDAVPADLRVTLKLATRQVAIIQPARGHHLANLQHWDSWMTTLSAAAVAELDNLDHD